MILNMCLIFSSFGGCWVISNFVIFHQIKVAKYIWGTHAATRWQKLPADLSSLKIIIYKQSARWQHLSRLKASAFFSL